MAESQFLPTVTLFDWWLVKSPDNRLSISGISSRKGEAVRVFNSSPIVIRYDETYLETADGISILIRGIINKERTLENGFTTEIFKSFYFSFPPNWESRALDCFREEAEHVTDSVNADMDTVSATCEDISSEGEQNSVPVSLVLPEEALGNRKEPFTAEECNDSKEMSRCDVVYCSTRLHDIKVCQQKQQQPASGGSPRHPDKEQSSFLKALENHVLDAVVLDNVSENLPKMSSDAVEKSFPTLVSPEKAARDCKQFGEDEHDISIKTSEVNIVQCSALENHDLDAVVLDNVSENLPKISSDGGGNSIPVSLVLPEEALGNHKEPFAAEECNDSKETSRCDVVYCSTGLHDINVCQQKQQQPTSGGSLRHPDKEQSSFSKALENHDFDTVFLDNVSKNIPEISSDAVEKSFPTLVSPEKAARDCKQFVEYEHDISIKMSEVNIVQCSVGNRRSARLRNVKVYPRKQPTTRGPSKHPDEDQISDSVNAVMDTVSATCQDISSDDNEKSISILLELPEEAQENNLTPFPGDECEVLNETSGVNVASGSVGNIRSTRLHNINLCQPKKIKKQMQQQQQQPRSRGRPLKHSHEEPSSTSKAVENCDLDAAHLDNVSANLPEISRGVTPEKDMKHCNKLFVEGEEHMSIKTGEANVVHGSGGNRLSARLHNVKQQQQPRSRCRPRKHSHEEPRSTSKAVENCDLDTAHLDNVSANLSEISRGH